MDQFFKLSATEALAKLSTSKHGLSEEEAQKRLAEYGENKLTAKKKVSAWSIFLDQFKNILTLILIGSAFLIFFIYFFGEKDPSDLLEAGLILAIVLMITFLGFIQEYKAEKAIESLKKLLAFKAKVRRLGKDLEIDVAKLVPGDIVILEEGEKIPADIRLLEVFSLSVNEASLTGESANVSKHSEAIKEDKQIADQKNMLFSGTAISSGRGIGLVVATGDKTEIGKIAHLVSQEGEETTPIQKRLNDIGKILGLGVLGVCAIVFVFIVFFAGDYASQSLLSKIIHSFIASVALAVAAIPEGLPAVVTISLALGTQRMLRKKALVRKLNSVETLGSTNVICADKTGTLTKGEMTVTQIVSGEKIYQVSGTGYELKGEFTYEGKSALTKDLEQLLLAGLLCNNAKLENSKVLGDPTEAALLVSAAKANLTPQSERIQEFPFSSERKMMSVVIKQGEKLILYAKGAPEVILGHCDLSPAQKEKVLEQTRQMSQKALRNLAFAYKEIAEKDLKNEAEAETHLIYLGLQGMIDPAREEVRPLIESCNASGIKVIMITGDHVDTAKAVAREIGIMGESLSGEELEKISDSDLATIIEKVSIYARVNPGVKLRIIKALKANGHTVAMTGDGVNDAPAIKKADIGIAMGITGTDVAKEASDMILMDDRFSTIVSAIEEGRGIFLNIRKFVDYLLSCNIGEVLVVFLAVMIFKELPLTATMLLWINVVTDGLPAIALGIDPSPKDIMKHKPSVFQSEIITRKMWVKMVIFGIFMTVGVLGIYALNLKEGFDEAKGAAFSALVVFEIVRLYLIRSDYKLSFFSNKWLLAAITTSLSLQLLITYYPFLAKIFNIKNIDLFDWGYMIVGSVILWVSFKAAEALVVDKLFTLQSDG